MHITEVLQKSFKSIAKRGYKSIAKRGVITTLRFMYSEIIFDKKRNIKTSDSTSLRDLAIVNHNANDYCDYKDYYPTNPYLLDMIFNFLVNNYNLDEMGFIDFGSGKGRVVIYASDYKFKKIVGVEFSIELFDATINNIEKLNNNKVSVFNVDATSFDINDKLNVFYFFNPFVGDVMERVLKNIDQSYTNNQRDILIVYVHPVCKDQVLADNNYQIVKEFGGGEVLIFERKHNIHSTNLQDQ